MSAPEVPESPPAAAPDRSPVRALRVIAVYKFCKTALAILIGLGSLRLLRPDVAAWAERWSAALALRHDRRLLGQLIALVSGLSPHVLREFAIGAFAVALLFFVEGVGLWMGKRWAEYLTVVATTLFLPFEIVQFARRETSGRLAAVLLNLAVVVVLIYLLRRVEAARAA